MPNSEAIDLTGKVTEVLPNSQYRVTLDNGHQILAYAAGKLKLRRIRILAGDIVQVHVSPYDLTRGRIHWRDK